MADISEYLDNDLTLSKVSDALLKKASERKRFYLGMSEIGEACWRMLWYRFRKVKADSMTLQSLLAIEDGYKQEDIMAERLRMVEGLQLETLDPKTKKQFEYKMFGGHFGGHCDGRIIKGLLEAPKTPHIWENKAVKEEKFKKLQDLVLDVGEKKALESWDDVYYSQAQMYMNREKYTRHYLTVQKPGGRGYTSVRTEYNKKIALSLIGKAEHIIKADRPPARMSENRSFYRCSWCGMKEICFDNRVPEVNCRTCAFSEPDTEDKSGAASWKCHRKNISFTGEKSACDEHLFLNTLVPFKTVDADPDGIPNWIKYEHEGSVFYNTNSKAKTINDSPVFLTSFQIYEKEFFELCFAEERVKSANLKARQEDKKVTKKIKGLI
jgi:hypothetical protein